MTKVGLAEIAVRPGEVEGKLALHFFKRACCVPLVTHQKRGIKASQHTRETNLMSTTIMRWGLGSFSVQSLACSLARLA